MANNLFGASIKRKEDPRLITGEAKYMDDVVLPGMTYLAILRSPYAHANIKSINIEKAKTAPGVVGVFTGEDFKDFPKLPAAWVVTGCQVNVNTPRFLEIGKVTYAGQGIAAVVAEDRAQAEDALALIDVEWEPLGVVTDAEKATQPGAPQLHENAPNNVCMDWTCGDESAVDGALGSADVVVKQRLINQRLQPTPMETRGCVASYLPHSEEYTLWVTSQAPHVHRLLMTAFVFAIPETKMRVIAPQVGGGFGAKIFLYSEYCVATALAKRLGRPVKWMETRRENYVATTHGRDHITDIEVGAQKDGKITSLKVHTFANLGGTLSTIATGIPTTLYGRLLSGAYKIPNIFCRTIGVYSNTSMVDAYRGAGRPEATYVVERAVDLVANKLGLDPAEVRRKNFIQPADFPYAPANNILAGLSYDSGEYETALNKALANVGYANFRKDQAELRKVGRYTGIGLSSYIEICGVAPSAWIGATGQGWGAGLWESANVRVHLTGKVVVTTGSQNHGQGLETTAAQVVASELGMSVDDITVQHSDTQGTPFGYGTYGSRSTAVGMVAIFNSVQRIKEKAKKLAAHLLEASEEDMVYGDDGKIYVKGSPDKFKTIGDVAAQAALAYNLPKGMEPFLDDLAYYDPPNCTYPFGTHAVVVEVDTDTGQIDLKRYVAVDDVGNPINPMIINGQIHGGLAQGVGQALWEEAIYDDAGQLSSGSMMEYAVPKAHFFPSFELDHTITPSPVNPMGVKGAGEAATIGSAPAVVNAVMDALAPFGITHLDMPLTPQKVWAAIHQKKN